MVEYEIVMEVFSMEAFQLTRSEALFIHKWQKEVPGLTAGFTTRNNGKSNQPYNTLNLGLHVKDNKADVLENRNILGESISFPLEDWVSAEQVHGTNISLINSSDKGKGAKNIEDAIKNVDGLISKDSSLLATAFYADCVPLFFIDPVTKWFGIAHAGWRGTVGRIGEKMVDALCEQGSDFNDIKAAIGPSISWKFYEVDDHVINHIPSKWHSLIVKPKENGKYLLNLKVLNELILLEAGLKKDNIEISSYCTYEDSDLFFSHRRDHGKTGRMLGFIGFSY